MYTSNTVYILLPGLVLGNCEGTIHHLLQVYGILPLLHTLTFAWVPTLYIYKLGEFGRSKITGITLVSFNCGNF